MYEISVFCRSFCIHCKNFCDQSEHILCAINSCWYVPKLLCIHCNKNAKPTWTSSLCNVQLFVYDKAFVHSLHECTMMMAPNLNLWIYQNSKLWSTFKVDLSGRFQKLKHKPKFVREPRGNIDSKNVGEILHHSCHTHYLHHLQFSSSEATSGMFTSSNIP